MQRVRKGCICSKKTYDLPFNQADSKNNDNNQHNNDNHWNSDYNRHGKVF